MNISEETKQRFWAKVKKTDSCWLWIGSMDRYGYGQIRIARKLYYATHVSWMIATGNPVPQGKWMLHDCDNPACICPAHLRPGTRAENMVDAKKRGRLATGERHGTHTQPQNKASGERNGHHKLTLKQVSEIRELYARGGITHQKLADIYGVGRQTITSVIRHINWKHSG